MADKLPVNKFHLLLPALIGAGSLFAGNFGAGGSGLQFTENKGQIIDQSGRRRHDILFKGTGQGADVFLRKTGFSYLFTNRAEGMDKVNQGILQMHRIDMDFSGCNKTCTLLKEEELSGYTNYYLAHCPKGITHVKQYNKVTYKNIYNNIDMVCHGDKANSLEYDLVVKPHGDPGQVKLEWKGAETILLDPQGRLVVKTSLNEFYESIPRVYQIINGKTVDVKAEYSLKQVVNLAHPDLWLDKSEQLMDNYEVTFKIQSYRTDCNLIIDPSVTWITYYGGQPVPGQSEDGNSVVTDGQHNVIYSGYTESGTFPVTIGANHGIMHLGGDSDPALVKFAPNGTRIWATYFGGSGWDAGSGVTVDANNNIYQVGTTMSSDFPVQAWGAAFLQPKDNSLNKLPFNAWLAQFTPAGVLIWSTYYGGSAAEFGEDIITDPNGDIVITGSTSSTDFPVQAPYQPNNLSLGNTNAYIVLFNNTGVRQWATYYGGSSADEGTGICSDVNNNIYVTGRTSSNNFPVVGGALASQPAYGGGANDAFICQFNSGTGKPNWSTYYGGGGNDFGTSIVTDNANHLFVGLHTESGNAISSGPGVYQPALNGPEDGAILKFNVGGGKPIWATYIGGTGVDEVTGLAIDNFNNILAGGNSNSTNYPVSSCAFQTKMIGTEDMTITKFDPQGNLLGATYVGIGSVATDEVSMNGLGGGSIAVDGNFAYLIGYGGNASLPVTAGAFQTTFGVPNGQPLASTVGGNWAFVKLCTYTMNLEGQGQAGSFVTAPGMLCAQKPVAFTLDNSCDTLNTTYAWTFTGANTGTSTAHYPKGIVWNSAGNYPVSVIMMSPCDTITINQQISIGSCGGNITAQASGGFVCSGSCVVVTSSGGGGTAPYTYSWNTGATSATFHSCPLANATYTVTITDASSLSATATAALVLDPVLTLSTTPTGISCHGGDNGIASALTTGGSAGFVYTWSNGSSGSPASGLSPGNYTVTVTDVNGCTATNIVSITQPTALVPLASQQTGAGCSNNPGTGVATVSASGGTGQYTYTWSNAQGGTTDTGLTPGTYTVTANDGNGCSQTAVAAISSIPAPAINTLTENPPSCNGGDNGSAVVTATGTGTLTYSWSNLVTGVTGITGLKAGIYAVSVTDVNGCTAVSTVNVTQPDPLVPVAVQQSGAGCTNNPGMGLATVSSTGGSGQYTYTWSNGSSGSTAQNLAADSYTVQVTDANSCTATETVTIDGKAPPLIGVVSTTSPLCFGGKGGSATVNASGGTGALTYSWSSGLAGITATETTGLSQGTYTISVTDASACMATSTISLSQPGLLVPLAIQKMGAGCSNSPGTGVAIVSSSGGTPGYNYTWSNAQSGTTDIDLTPGTYTVTVTDGNGCTQTSLAAISSIPAPTINSLTDIPLLCNGADNGSATVVASGGTGQLTYSWSNAAAGAAALTGLKAGTYAVSVTDANGCTAVSAVDVSQPQALNPVIAQQINTTCGNSTGSATVSSTGGTGGDSFTWSSGSNNTTAQNLPAGIYTVTATDANGCTASNTAIISNSNGPAINSVLTASPFCFGGNGGSASVSASGGTGPLTYSWSNGSPAVTVSGLTAGNYEVTVTDANGCIALTLVNVTEPTVLSALASQQTAAACGNNTGIAMVSSTGGTGFDSYVWSNAQGGTNDIDLAPGTYSVTVTDANNCSVSTTATIGETQGPTLSILSTTNTCRGKQEGTITLASTGTGDSYTWSNGLSGSSLTISGLDSGSYSVTVTDINGCTAASTTHIDTLANPLVQAGTSQTITQGQSVMISATGGVSYLWRPSSSLNDSIIYNPTAAPAHTTTYTVIVTDGHNCTARDSVIIKVIDCDSLSLFVPDAFSPNGDGKNDMLYVRGANCIQVMRFSVYDRWGELVFSTTSTSQGWDGNFKSKPEDQGVFMYILSGTFTNGQIVNRKGNVTLLR